jgi:hypothetical protein
LLAARALSGERGNVRIGGNHSAARDFTPPTREHCAVRDIRSQAILAFSQALRWYVARAT